MAPANLCRLCMSICQGRKSLYDESGRKNLLYEITRKYFHPTIVNLEEAQHLKVICLPCWRHIRDFHSFQAAIQVAQLDLTFQVEDEEVQIVENDQLSQVYEVQSDEVEREVLNLPTAVKIEKDSFEVPSKDETDKRPLTQELESLPKAINERPVTRPVNSSTAMPLQAAGELSAVPLKETIKSNGESETEIDSDFIPNSCRRPITKELMSPTSSSRILALKLEEEFYAVPSTRMYMDSDESDSSNGHRDSIDEDLLRLSKATTEFPMPKSPPIKEELFSLPKKDSNRADSLKVSDLIETEAKLVISSGSASITDLEDMAICSEISEEVATIDLCKADPPELDVNKVRDKIQCISDEDMSSDQNQDNDCSWVQQVSDISSTDDIEVLEADNEPLCIGFSSDDNRALYAILDTTNETEKDKAHNSQTVTTKNPNSAGNLPTQTNSKNNPNATSSQDRPPVQTTSNSSALVLSDRYKTRAHNLDVIIAKWQPVITCVACPKTWSKYTLYRQHFHHEHPLKEFHILCCKRKFHTRSQIEEHCLLHRNPNLFRCHLCGERLTSKSSLHSHVGQRHAVGKDRKYRCPRCSDVFATEKARFQHCVRRHATAKPPKREVPSGGSDVDSKYTCRECGRVSYSLPAFCKHRCYVPQVKHTCHECGKTFSLVGDMHKHAASHRTQPSTYSCYYCRMTFTTGTFLRNHECSQHLSSSSSSSAVFKCPVCGQGLNSQRLLNSHMGRQHSESHQNQSFAAKRDLSSQPKVSNKEQSVRKPQQRHLHRCKHCGKLFQNVKALLQHARCHRNRHML